MYEIKYIFVGGSSILGGRVMAIACESSGRMFWAANDKVPILNFSLCLKIFKSANLDMNQLNIRYIILLFISIVN